MGQHTTHQFQIYLLLGQSNMAGRGDVPALKPASDPRIMMLTRDNQWVTAADPIHFDKPKAGVGPGSTFARVMLKAETNPAVRIGLVPCAVGGSPLARWQKGADLFTTAVSRATIAQQTGTLRAVLWHQGENDSGNETDATTYTARFSQMIQDFREAVGVKDLPVVVGKLCEAFEQVPSYPFARVVNQAIEKLPQTVPFCACVDSAGLGHKGDSTHFNTEAQIEFGNRYAAVAQSLLKLTHALEPRVGTVAG